MLAIGLPSGFIVLSLLEINIRYSKLSHDAATMRHSVRAVMQLATATLHCRPDASITTPPPFFL
jgi:hypothetical protein